MEITHIEPNAETKKRKVAAYCRVSTAMDSQETSIELQKDYYVHYIRSNPNWKYAGIYFDEKSGTDALNRSGFQKMLTDAKRGKIDLILCKSISRFARNVVDSEKALNLLTGYNTYVYFEKENMRSDDPSCSILLSILSAIAQNESKSISQNIRWAYEERVKRGEYTYGSNRVLGYDCIDGVLIPNDKAEIVKTIFFLFAEGKSFSYILSFLKKHNYTGLRGKNFEQTSLLYILSNPVYVGDLLLQKKELIEETSPVLYISDKIKSGNNYHHNHHQPIIDRKTWEVVQYRLKERKSTIDTGIRSRPDVSFLSGKIFCECCGQVYVRRSSVKKTTEGTCSVPSWICKSKRSKKTSKKCFSHILTEEYILKEISDKTNINFTDKANAERQFLNNYKGVSVSRYTISLIEK